MKRRNFLKGLLGAGISSILPSKSFANKSKIKIGVVSDIEGDFRNIHRSALKLKREGVDLIIVAGDLFENPLMRRFPTVNDKLKTTDQMVLGLQHYAELEVPVFVIPGNHEEKEIFNLGLFKLNSTGYPNVYDLSKNPLFLDTCTVVGMAGYHEPRYTIRDGFLLSQKDYHEFQKNIVNGINRHLLTIIITHGPPKTKDKIDRTYEEENVGDEELTKIMTNPHISNILHICGGIHEAGGNYHRFSQDKVSINTASVTKFSSDTKNRATIISVSKEEVDWKFIE